MAIMIPENISMNKNATGGENRMFNILKELLPDDYIVWYELRVKRKHSDFIILGPETGLVVLEIKDWNISSIVRANQNTYELGTDIGTTQNPQQQARQYMIDIVNKLKKVEELQNKDPKYKGKPIFKYGSGVVFTKIQKKSFELRGLDETIDMDTTFFADDLKYMEASKDSQYLLKRLKAIAPYDLGDLAYNQIQTVRGHLFREVRLLNNEDVFKVMRVEQEQLAKGLGYGHRVIRGVAGSGKTLVLTCRAQYLARNHEDWKILALCFNTVLATHLKNVIEAEKYSNLESKHFHQWIREIGQQVDLKCGIKDEEITHMLEAIRSDYLDKLEKYDAILIDEGQDMAKEWLEFIVNMLRSPQKSHLLLASDGAQNLYNRKYTLKSVGIQAAGRTKILRENYRNTKQILDCANGFLKDDQVHASSDSEDNNFMIEADTAARTGPEPFIKECSSFDEEVDETIKKIKLLRDMGVQPRDICILYFNKNQLGHIESKLIDQKIYYNPISKSAEHKRNFDYSNNVVKVSTIHSAKGLDFDYIFILGFGKGLDKRYNESKKLIYVGMTRAKNQLMITYSSSNMGKIVSGIAELSKPRKVEKVIEDNVVVKEDEPAYYSEKIEVRKMAKKRSFIEKVFSVLMR